jgi:hypothetical protein
MKSTISGNELRDRFLARMKLPAPEPTEEARIEALASRGNRELLALVATKGPRSISELATLARRLQPNVSRSLNALARAGLLTMTLDGRASVPTLTAEGQRRAQDLGFAAEAAFSTDESSLDAVGYDLLSAEMTGSFSGDLSSDMVEAEIVARFPTPDGRDPVIARGRCDLNEICVNLLANWWRMLCRRAAPFKMFAVGQEAGAGTSRAMLSVRSAGDRIELLARPISGDPGTWSFPCPTMQEASFAKLVLDHLVGPVLLSLHAGRRFDRPIESLLRRVEEISGFPRELTFWRTAGALGFLLHDINEPDANNVKTLIKTISEEDARFEFASSIVPEQLSQSLNWVAAELKDKASTNSLPGLSELRLERPGIGSGAARPWQIGYEFARHARKRMGLAPDCAVAGVAGLSSILGGSMRFTASHAGEEPLRGFQGRGDNIPIVVVKDEGPISTAFLMARAIGDYMVFGSRDAPIANIYSDRQAVGRKFAAEFLAPADGVIHMVEEQDVPMANVAEHYGVALEVVERQYKNSLGQFLDWGIGAPFAHGEAPSAAA